MLDSAMLSLKIQSSLASLSNSIYLLLMSFALALSTRNTGVKIIIFDSGACFCMKDFRSFDSVQHFFGCSMGRIISSNVENYFVRIFSQMRYYKELHITNGCTRECSNFYCFSFRHFELSET